MRKVFSYLWGLWKFSEHLDYVQIKLWLYEYIRMKNLIKIYYLIWKLSVVSSAFVQSKGILRIHIRAAVGEKHSFLISHPNLPSQFYESSEMSAKTKPSLITLSQKQNRKKSRVAALAFLICNWNGMGRVESISRAGRPTALKIKGHTQNSCFQTGFQGVVNQPPSSQDECKCDYERSCAHPGTNAAPHQPGVSSEPCGCAGAALCHCSLELEQPSFPIPCWRPVEIHCCHTWACQAFWPLPSALFTLLMVAQP